MNTVTINNKQLPAVEYRGQRVVTFAMIDEAHQRPDGTAGRNFRENRNYFVEGVDYVELGSDAIRRKVCFLSLRPLELCFSSLDI